MFSLQRILGKDEKFFDLLEASAEEAHYSVQALVKYLGHPDTKETLSQLMETRRKDKRITAEITEELCKTFVTPLEREDIEALSNTLYKIPKTVEKFVERISVCPQDVRNSYLIRQAAILEKATHTLLFMVRQLRARAHLEKIKDQNDHLQQLEGEADKLMVDMLRDLYSGQHDPLRVVILKDLYELLERVIDRCRDAGNVIFQIVLKNS
jgi:uncharacterized protein